MLVLMISIGGQFLEELQCNAGDKSCDGRIDSYEVPEDANVHPVTTKYLESEKWKNNKIVKVEITFGIKVLLLEQMNGNFMT